MTSHPRSVIDISYTTDAILPLNYTLLDSRQHDTFRCAATQFAVAAANRSALNSNEMRRVE